MNRVFEIESAVAIPDRTWLAALSAEGVEAVIVDTHPRMRLSAAAADPRRLGAAVQSALERVISDLALPLVAQRVGTSAFCVRPPAG